MKSEHSVELCSNLQWSPEQMQGVEVAISALLSTETAGPRESPGQTQLAMRLPFRDPVLFKMTNGRVHFFPKRKEQVPASIPERLGHARSGGVSGVPSA